MYNKDGKSSFPYLSMIYRFSKGRDKMKKILTKAVAALASAMTLSSMAGAIPTSAIDMSYGVGKNSAMRYTVYTTKLSDTQIKLTVKITNNPGIGAITLLVKSDPAFKGKNDSERCDLPNRLVSGTYVYNVGTCPFPIKKVSAIPHKVSSMSGI